MTWAHLASGCTLLPNRCKELGSIIYTISPNQDSNRYYSMYGCCVRHNLAKRKCTVKTKDGLITNDPKSFHALQTYRKNDDSDIKSLIESISIQIRFYSCY